MQSELPTPLPTSPTPQASSSSGSGTGLMTSKDPWGPKDVREVGEPLLHLGSCQSILVIISRNGTRTSYYAKRPGSGTASATAGDWSLGALAREGCLEEITLNEFSRSLLSGTCCFLGARQHEGLRGSEGHGAPPGCAQARCAGSAGFPAGS